MDWEFWADREFWTVMGGVFFWWADWEFRSSLGLGTENVSLVVEFRRAQLTNRSVLLLNSPVK